MIEQALIIGRPAGMEQLIGELLAHSRSARFFARMQDLSTDLEVAPALVLICQHWPEEYTTAQVQALLSRYPLARMICCYGPWCASDGRTRNIWPAAVRVPLAHAGDRLRRELMVIAGKCPPLPLTAGLDEIFDFDHGETESSAV